MQLSINLAKFTAKEAAFLNLSVETPHAHYFIVSRRARYHPQYRFAYNKIICTVGVFIRNWNGMEP